MHSELKTMKESTSGEKQAAGAMGVEKDRKDKEDEYANEKLLKQEEEIVQLRHNIQTAKAQIELRVKRRLEIEKELQVTEKEVRRLRAENKGQSEKHKSLSDKHEGAIKERDQLQLIIQMTEQQRESANREIEEIVQQTEKEIVELRQTMRALSAPSIKLNSQSQQDNFVSDVGNEASVYLSNTPSQLAQTQKSGYTLSLSHLTPSLMKLPVIIPPSSLSFAPSTGSASAK
ncbi:MAG: hypothetical protein EZS28_031855 [Streblomastix strix]|uniref:Uncharacterized protein n=1 Tax=Streblomastix strix TaxID=222440 RepID=A0A5J4UQD4_9EUKA|nr:MAG: hypothetical protein EZS28_031855 [Streblomastix strix]